MIHQNCTRSRAVMQLFSPGVVVRVRDWDAIQGLLVLRLHADFVLHWSDSSANAIDLFELVVAEAAEVRAD